MKLSATILFTFLAILLTGCFNASSDLNGIEAGRNISSSKGMVVSAHREASIAGVKILKKGGNAVDAAVATGFALAACYPEAGNLGGGGFMLIRMADGTKNVLDYREKAPLKATRNMYLDNNGNPVEGLSTSTFLASGVPGSVDGLLEAHRKYGRLPLKDVIQPAIDLAENGYILSDGQARSLNGSRDAFLSRNMKPTAFAKDSLWKEGDLFRQPELALTLTLIRDKGREGFYSGKIAELIVNQMEDNKGLISKEDLDSYNSVWRNTIEGNYHGYKIITIPPPSGGGIALLQMLGMVEKFRLQEKEFHSTASIHIMVEAERRAFADRAFFAGDADFVKVPVKGLTDSSYLLERMSDFDPGKATPSALIRQGDPTDAESEETTHYSVVDSEGNAVSTTTTLNGTFGSCISVAGAGFLLNNEMDDFSVKPGFPNMYGLTGGEANSIVPGKRMLSSMTPVIITKGDSLFMVTGSPGGSTIPTTVFQNILNVIDFRMDIGMATDENRFHHQWLPDLVFMEEGTADSLVVSGLERMGYIIRIRGQIGSVNAILRNGKGILYSGADRRGNNSAAGY